MKNSPDGNIFCVHCGQNLDLSFAAVKLANKEKNLLSRNETMSHHTRTWMRMTFVLLAACVIPWFFRPSAPPVYVLPPYPILPASTGADSVHDAPAPYWNAPEVQEGLAVRRPMMIVPLDQAELRQNAPAPYEMIPQKR